MFFKIFYNPLHSFSASYILEHEHPDGVLMKGNIMYNATELYAFFDVEGSGEHVEIGLHQFEISNTLLTALRNAALGGFTDAVDHDYTDQDIRLVIENDNDAIQALKLSSLLKRGLQDDETIVGWKLADHVV